MPNRLLCFGDKMPSPSLSRPQRKTTGTRHAPIGLAAFWMAGASQAQISLAPDMVPIDWNGCFCDTTKKAFSATYGPKKYGGATACASGQ
jgi:hypothetical protein